MRFASALLASLVSIAPAGATPPTAPTNCDASDTLCDHIAVSWTDTSTNELGFEIQRDLAAIDSVGVDVTAYIDASAAPGYYYDYRVVAYNADGRSTSNTDTGRRLPPLLPPREAAASTDLCSLVHVTWINGQFLQLGIDIWRDGEILASVGRHEQEFWDSTAVSGQAYEYVVDVSGACGHAFSDTVVGRSTELPPHAPTNLSASDDLCFLVRLAWNDESDDETGFEIRRDGALLATVDPNMTAYEDTSAEVDQTYTYTITSLSLCGPSNLSNADEGTRRENVLLEAPALASPDPDATCLFAPVTFVWHPVADVATYDFEILQTGEGTPFITESTTDTMLTIELEPGDYAWRVRGRNTCDIPWDWSERPVEVSSNELDTPDVNLSTEDGLTWRIYWPAVHDADYYRVVITDTDCYTYGPKTTVTYTTDTEVTFDWPPIVNYHFTAWVTAFGCVESDSSQCVTNQEPAVLLEHFTATSQPDGIRLDWRTLREIGTLGFLVYRSQDGTMGAKLNEVPVAAGPRTYTLLDADVRDGMRYTYTLVEVETGGAENVLADVDVVANLAPIVFDVHAHPNPFNPRVTIRVDVPVACDARLDVLDASGRVVTRLLERPLTAGRHALVWDGTDTAGRRAASGVYFLVLRAGHASRTERLLLVR